MKKTQNQKDLIILQLKKQIQTLLDKSRTSNDQLIIADITSLANDYTDLALQISNTILKISMEKHRFNPCQ